SYRGCWHELSPCFLQGSVKPLPTFLPLDRSLQPEGLRPPRGVARSGLRPLPKILDFSLPEESGHCLSPSVPDLARTPGRHSHLGGPLPRQQANTTTARPATPKLWQNTEAGVVASLGITRGFPRLYP